MQIKLKEFFWFIIILTIISGHIWHAESKYDNIKFLKIL